MVLLNLFYWWDFIIVVAPCYLKTSKKSQAFASASDQGQLTCAWKKLGTTVLGTSPDVIPLHPYFLVTQPVQAPKETSIDGRSFKNSPLPLDGISITTFSLEIFYLEEKYIYTQSFYLLKKNSSLVRYLYRNPTFSMTFHTQVSK